MTNLSLAKLAMIYLNPSKDNPSENLWGGFWLVDAEEPYSYGVRSYCIADKNTQRKILY